MATPTKHDRVVRREICSIITKGIYVHAVECSHLTPSHLSPHTLTSLLVPHSSLIPLYTLTPITLTPHTNHPHPLTGTRTLSFSEGVESDREAAYLVAVKEKVCSHAHFLSGLHSVPLPLVPVRFHVWTQCVWIVFSGHEYWTVSCESVHHPQKYVCDHKYLWALHKLFPHQINIVVTTNICGYFINYFPHQINIVVTTNICGYFINYFLTREILL